MKSIVAPKRFAVAWSIMGFTSLVGQVVLLRELLVVFYGNEASLGIMLACWLFWVGVGSLFIGRVVLNIKDKMRAFVLSQIFMALFIPISILLVRISKITLGISPGEIIGLFPMMFISFFLLAPFCSILGFLFALSCRLFMPENKQAAGYIGRVYVYEAIGATLGGALFSYFLIRFFHPFLIVWFVSTLNICSALSIAASKRYFTNRFAAVALLLLLVVDLFLGIPVVNRLQRLSVEWQWPGFTVRSSRDSIYGNITVNERAGQLSIFENGLLMFANPDRFSAEESVHFALLEHPHPKHVLLIGGGVSGALREILKHPVEDVTYVELDPLIIEMSKRYIFATELKLDDPRVSIHHIDGRLFMKQAQKQYDVIIVNLPEPYTTQLNRFYTVEFYQEAKDILSPDGILSFRVTSAENYINDELGQLLASFYQTLNRVFEDVVMLPGNTNIFLACSKKGILTDESDVLMDRLRQRSIETQYIQEYYLPFRLVDERIDYLNNRIGEAKSVKINTDFHPISSFYDMVHWTTQFRTNLPSILRLLGSLTLSWILIPLGALSLVIFVWSLRSVALRRASLLIAVGVTGALEIIFEVVILLAFQVLYGFVYARVGIILMGFMVGLTAGGMWMTRCVERSNVSMGSFLKIQGALGVYPILLIGVFKALSVSRGEAGEFISTEILFPFMTAVGGFLGGMQFPLANKLYIEQKGRVGHVGGMSYGIDVLGSSLGALLAGSILIPVLGIWSTCIILACLSFCTLFLLLPLSLKRNERSLV